MDYSPVWFPMIPIETLKRPRNAFAGRVFLKKTPLNMPCGSGSTVNRIMQTWCETQRIFPQGILLSLKVLLKDPIMSERFLLRILSLLMLWLRIPILVQSV